MTAGGSVKATLESTGMPLGVDPDGEFEAISAGKLEAGDTVLLLTDGIVEARGPSKSAAEIQGPHIGDREIFGTERAVEVVRQHITRSARDIVQALHDAVNSFTGDDPQVDDVTAVIVKAL